MEGTAKFARGAAVAARLITLINLVGGVIIGVVMDGRALTDALHRYAVLSVGDGLVSQIPALLISTASGVIVTKTSVDARLSQAMALPFLSNPRAMVTSAAVLAGIGMLPGIPTIPFLVMAGIVYALYSQTKDVDAPAPAAAAAKGAGAKGGKSGGAKGDGEPHESKGVEDLLAVDRLNVEI